MINVTVINLKSAVKYLIAILIIVIGISSLKVLFNKGKTVFTKQVDNISFTQCLDVTLPKIDTKNRKQEETTTRSSGLRRLLNVELPVMDNFLIIDGEEDEEIQVPQEESKENQQNNIEMAEADVQTQEIQEHNITPKYNMEYGTVKIKNESDREIPQDVLIPNISLENNKDIIIFHTHTCESYTPSANFNYEMTGSYRTTDLNFSVARVGEELKKYLTEYGYNVIHDQTYHDYPAYSGSYSRSLTTVENILKNTKDAQMVIDLHRDAVRK